MIGHVIRLASMAAELDHHCAHAERSRGRHGQRAERPGSWHPVILRRTAICRDRQRRKLPETIELWHTKPWYTNKDIAIVNARNTSVTLGDHMLSFAQQQVASGRYSSTSDVIRAGLRLLEEHESRLQALQAALIAGENSGASTPFDFDSFIAAKRARLPGG